MPEVTALLGHPFEQYPFAWPTCSRVEVTDGVGRPCDRPEHEHAPAVEEETAGT